MDELEQKLNEAISDDAIGIWFQRELDKAYTEGRKDELKNQIAAANNDETWGIDDIVATLIELDKEAKMESKPGLTAKEQQAYRRGYDTAIKSYAVQNYEEGFQAGLTAALEALPGEMGEGLQPLYSKGYNQALIQARTNIKLKGD